MEMSMLEFWWIEVVGTVTDYFMFAGGLFFLFYVILKNPLWFRKIQKKVPKMTDYGRDIMYSMISVGIFGTVAVIVFYFNGDHTNQYQDINEYSITYYAFTWVYMFLIHDTYFYWMHRMMHHPTLFKKVHLVHHMSNNPSPWTAYAFHPLEAILESMIVPILAFGIPVHGPAVGSFLLFQIIYNVYGHLGFEIYPKNFHKTWIGKWVNTAVAHDLHHKGSRGNYGLYFLIWDRMMGTLRSDYDATYEATTNSNH